MTLNPAAARRHAEHCCSFATRQPSFENWRECGRKSVRRTKRNTAGQSRDQSIAAAPRLFSLGHSGHARTTRSAKFTLGSSKTRCSVFPTRLHVSRVGVHFLFFKTLFPRRFGIPQHQIHPRLHNLLRITNPRRAHDRSPVSLHLLYTYLALLQVGDRSRH